MKQSKMPKIWKTSVLLSGKQQNYLRFLSIFWIIFLDLFFVPSRCCCRWTETSKATIVESLLTDCFTFSASLVYNFTDWESLNNFADVGFFIFIFSFFGVLVFPNVFRSWNYIQVRTVKTETKENEEKRNSFHSFRRRFPGSQQNVTVLFRLCLRFCLRRYRCLGEQSKLIKLFIPQCQWISKPRTQVRSLIYRNW